jgi:hypothetical protein
MEKERQGFAITSFVLALVGLLVFGLPLGILAIIFGALSFERGLGKAGMFIGIFDVVMVLFWVLAL